MTGILKTTGTGTYLKNIFKGMPGTRSREAAAEKKMKDEDSFRESLTRHLECQRQSINQERRMLETLKVAMQSDVKYSRDHLFGHKSCDVRPGNQPQMLALTIMKL